MNDKPRDPHLRCYSFERHPKPQCGSAATGAQQPVRQSALQEECRPKKVQALPWRVMPPAMQTAANYRATIAADPHRDPRRHSNEQHLKCKSRNPSFTHPRCKTAGRLIATYRDMGFIIDIYSHTPTQVELMSLFNHSNYVKRFPKH